MSANHYIGYTPSKHEPFEVTQAKRPDFQADRFHYTKQPNPDWKPGQGLNGRTDLPGYQAFIDGATLEGSQANFRHIDPEQVEDKGQIYKLMIGGITPRPIAFCSTISPEGVRGLAPFSYFAPMGHRPPLLMVHFSTSKPFKDGEGKHKDTLNNIKSTKEFVVNMISEPFAEASNHAAIDCPADVSEWDLTGLTPVPSDLVKPPRVGESAFCMECTLEFFHDIYDETNALTGTCVVGRVRKFHVRKDLFGPTNAIDTGKMLPISRLGGIGYGRTTDAFESLRPSWSDYAHNEPVSSQDPSANTNSRI